MPTLADIYSAIDTAKRKGSDLIRNPGASLQQMAGYGIDRANAARDQLYQATEEEGIGYGPKTQAIAKQMAEAYNPMGLTVWHGSPYKFSKFDASKIGTGEGNQAYGHGIYVAENPNVAKQYAENVKDMGSIAEYNAKLSRLSKIMNEDSKYPGAYRKFKSAKGENAANEYDLLMEQKLQKAKDPGTLYKVDLPDEHIAQMIDWDKPLSKQPKNVVNAIKGIEKELPTIPDFDLKKWMDTDPLASTWHNVINRDLKVEQPEISNILAKRGIPGIKYLDQNSRNAEQGTRNFVVFPKNEHLLQIQDLNGNPPK